MNLCNVKLEGPFGRRGKSEQMVEKYSWDVKIHSLFREVPRKRKPGRGENEDPHPRSHTYSWVRHFITCYRIE